MAILNEFKQIAIGKRILTIWGEYIETVSNQPCSSVYSDAQFIKKNDSWVFPISDVVEINNPEWLQIEHLENVYLFKGEG